MKGQDGIFFSFENSVANGSALTYCPVPDLRPCHRFCSVSVSVSLSVFLSVSVSVSGPFSVPEPTQWPFPRTQDVSHVRFGIP